MPSLFYRRALTRQPISRLAVWARRLAAFSLVAAALAIVIVRSGILEIYPAMAAFGGALAIAGLAAILAFASFVVIWRSGTRGLGQALAALAMAGALLAYPAYLAIEATRLPKLTDIVTDPADPPAFEVLARVRARDANPVAYPGPMAAAQQRQAYPDVEPYVTEAAPQMVYDAMHRVFAKRRWSILNERAPAAATRRDGIIEAVAVSPIMGFRDDVIVRIRMTADGTRVDMRSASRYGVTDIGAGASRIRSVLTALDEALASLPSAPAAPPPKAVPKAAPKKGQDKR